MAIIVSVRTIITEKLQTNYRKRAAESAQLVKGGPFFVTLRLFNVDHNLQCGKDSVCNGTTLPPLTTMGWHFVSLPANMPAKEIRVSSKTEKADTVHFSL